MAQELREILAVERIRHDHGAVVAQAGVELVERVGEGRVAVQHGHGAGAAAAAAASVASAPAADEGHRLAAAAGARLARGRLARAGG